MQNNKIISFIIIMLLAFSPIGARSTEVEYRCGIALGYPPYQHTDALGNPAGIDYEVAKLVFKTARLKVKFVQSEWDHLLSNIIYKTGNIDALCGAEITEERKARLDFSDPYYKRKIVLFTLKNSSIYKISDLYGKIITGDKQSFFEKYLGKDKGSIRVMETTSKEKSFLKLKDGSAVAVIAPKEVGLHIAKSLNIEVRTLEEKDPGSPVGIAVNKGNKDLLDKINLALRKLQKEGKIDKLILSMNKQKK